MAHAGTSVIHIGLHKVASTTLQFSLNQLRPELGAQGFYYPGDVLPHRTQQSDLAIFLRDANADRYQTAMAAVLRELREREHTNMLLSGEEFSLLSPEKIEMLYADLEKTGRPFRVVLYVRNLYRHTMSAIAQRSKSGKFPSHPDRGINRKTFNPSSIVSRWESVFGADNVVVACLEALPAGIDIVSHFAGLAGIRLPREYRVAHRNRSADPLASTLLSYLAYEFDLPHHLFYRSYFEKMPDSPVLSRTEDHLFGLIDRWVTGVDLTHPKLAPFRDVLCSRPPVHRETVTGAEAGAAYVRQLGMTLLRTAERMEEMDEQPKQGRHRDRLDRPS